MSTPGKFKDECVCGGWRLAVDVSFLRHLRAGLARYVFEMLSEIARLRPSLDIILYSAGPVDVRLGGSNWRLRSGSGFVSQVGSVWLQTICPRWLADDRADVFWGQNHMVPLRLKRNCVRVVTLHDLTAVVVPETMPLYSRLVGRAFLGRATRAADLVIADSRSTESLAISLLGVKSERVQVIYNGLSSSLTRRTDAHAAIAVSELPALPRRYLLAVGTIEPRKDHLTLFRALEMHSHLPPLVVVGGVGWRSDAILRQLRLLESAGRVVYLGRVSDEVLKRVYANALLTIYPSLYEGFGLPVLEAMASGCPVVCTWSSSITEVGGGAVRYFRPRDACGLGRLLAELVGSSEIRAKMVGAGLERARHFSYASAATEWLARVEPLLAGQSRTLD